MLENISVGQRGDNEAACVCRWNVDVIKQHGRLHAQPFWPLQSAPATITSEPMTLLHNIIELMHACFMHTAHSIT